MKRFSFFCIAAVSILHSVSIAVSAQPGDLSSAIEGGRGLMYMQSARTYGKGALITGAKGLVMNRKSTVWSASGMSREEVNYPVLVGVPVTFGLTDEVDITAAFYGFNDARILKEAADVRAGYGEPISGFGSTRFGVKIRMPLSTESRIQIAGKFAALIDTSKEQIDGLNYRWSRTGTDIETSIYETIDINSFMSLNLEQGYVVSGSDVYDDQIVGAAGLQIHIKKLLTVNLELANRTFLGVSPNSVLKAGESEYLFESVNDVPQTGNPAYLKDDSADYFDDFFVFSPSMVIRLNKNVSMDIGANINIADHAEPRERLQGVIGLTFRNEMKSMIDSDMDGVNNKLDKEPDTLAEYPVDADGVSLDTDRDGVPDGADREQNTPSGAKVDARGIGLDGDGDGVYDGLDMEPDTPEGCEVDQLGVAFDDDRDGVPNGLDRESFTLIGAIVDSEGVSLDSDGDGVPDGIDIEPDTPEGAQVYRNGASIDNDNDGVPDGIDIEPDTAAGALVDKSGRALVRSRPDLFVKGIIQKSVVNFASGSSEISVDSLSVLDEIASLLVQYPALKIQIGGHADSVGENTNNYELSRARALAARDYILSTYPDIAKNRLVAVGFGSEKPRGANTAAATGNQSRRVEFVVINQGDIINSNSNP
jgi:outer membrane protein OmpA-like peptidoglycan-associated protein